MFGRMRRRLYLRGLGNLEEGRWLGDKRKKK